MTQFYINQSGILYSGDIQPNDRIATETEINAYFSDKRGYAEKRAEEYPSIGDMIDAFCKAELGDKTELNTLIEQRTQIKSKYPKV